MKRDKVPILDQPWRDTHGEGVCAPLGGRDFFCHMLDRIRWQEPKQKSAGLRSKINITVDLAPAHLGAGRTLFEQALRTIFPSGWTKKDAQLVAMQAIMAVSKAICEDAEATFPLEAKMLHGSMRRAKPKDAVIIKVDFRCEQSAA